MGLFRPAWLVLLLWCFSCTIAPGNGIARFAIFFRCGAGTKLHGGGDAAPPATRSRHFPIRNSHQITLNVPIVSKPPFDGSPKSIAAVILAAGESSRLGQPKQLLEFRGKTLVRRVVDAAIEANCSPVIVVAGDAHAEVKNALAATNAILVQNSRWRQGVGTSIRAGIQRLIENAPEVDAAVLLVCDQPFVDCDLVRGLIALHSETGKPIVASAYADTLGVPALFDHSIFQELLRLDGHSGAKTIILSNRARVAEFSFPKGDVDVDTLDDVKRLFPNA